MNRLQKSVIGESVMEVEHDLITPAVLLAKNHCHELGHVRVNLARTRCGMARFSFFIILFYFGMSEQNDVPPYFSSVDIFVVSSLSEEEGP